MSFIETPRFPEDVSYGATAGPVWQTDVARVDSGVEYRNQGWSQAGFKADVAHAARVKTLYDTLLAFFYGVQGRTHGFRYKDWNDFEATVSTGVFSLLTSTTFQMYKRYTIGALVYNRKIVKPVSGTIAVTGGTSPTVETTTGIVTVASGTPTAWAGQFDVPCRFDVDHMPGEAITRSGGSLVMGWQGIQIVGLKL